MRSMICGVLALAATCGAMSSQASADERNHALAATQVTVGAASTGAFVAMTRKKHPFVPGAHKVGTSGWWGAYGLTTVGCIALSPIASAAVVGATEHRELTSREVFVMTGNCVVPFLGGLFWNAMFDAHPEWEGRVVKR